MSAYHEVIYHTFKESIWKSHSFEGIIFFEFFNIFNGRDYYLCYCIKIKLQMLLNIEESKIPVYNQY